MTRQRLEYLDSIRALAAIGVVYFHCIYEFAERAIPLSRFDQAATHIFLYNFDLGKVCVILFFFVSGYVVPFSLLKKSSNPARDFVISRIFRMYPAYWLSIPAWLIVCYAGVAEWPSLQTILVNLTMLQQFIGVENIIGLYWTLQIEIVFYCICLIMFLTGHLQRVRYLQIAIFAFLTIAIAMALIRFSIGKALPLALPLSLSVMFLGFLYRRWAVEGDVSARRPLLVAITVYLALIPPVCFFGYRDAADIGASWQRYWATYYVATALFFLLTGKVKLGVPILGYLGRISYSIYLFGGVVQKLLLAVMPLSALAGYMQLYALAVVIGTTLIAIPIYHLIEKPCIRAGRRLASKLDGGPSGRIEIEAV